jgi:uncharacterized HAD superfamily protein
MNIGLDFDGVISNCGKLKYDCAKKLYNLEIPARQFTREGVVGGGLLSMEQYREFQRNIYNTEIGFLMEPVIGMLEYLPKLIAEGHKVAVISWRDGDGLKIAREWLLLRGLTLDFFGVGYGNSKAKAVSGSDVFVDDSLDKLKSLIGIVPHLFLFSWDYNKHLDTGTAIKRVSSWEELYHKIQTLKGTG